MTLAAPRSRQGKFLFALLFVAGIAAAVFATVLWSGSADAGPVAVTADPADAANPPLTDHTVTFTLPAGVICESEYQGNLSVQGPTVTPVPDCISDDVVLVCDNDGSTILDVQKNGSLVDVTIDNNGVYDYCEISLLLRDDEGEVFASAIAIKRYQLAILGAETALLRHLDEADAATEDAAGSDTEGACLTASDPEDEFYPCGVLAPQDDVDDAISSFHQVCVEFTTLTDEVDGGFITWHIQNVSGNVTINPFPAGQKVAGPNGEPCVRWSSSGTGTQNISATYDNGVDEAVDLFWDPAVPLSVVKEWNTIDFTKIVGVDGSVGDTLPENTSELAAWGSRDCVDSTDFCGRANLDGTTRDVGGVLFPTQFGPECPPFSGGCISANGQSFIDYTMGAHSDVGGSYSGPVDGAVQDYFVSGDCGSVRLEDPQNGTVIILTPGQATTVLSSDKGVGFQILPNALGDVVTTISNADCQADSCTTVTIDTYEDDAVHSPPFLETEEETITVCWHVGPPTNKQPLLAWAGQRVMLEHDWSFTDVNGVRSCPFAPSGDGPFYVRYLKEAGNGGFVSDLGYGAATGPDFMVIQSSGSGDSNTSPDADCISRVVYEAQDQGEQDVVAHIVVCAPFITGGDAGASGQPPLILPDTCSVVSEQVAFLVYYMKFEDLTLSIESNAGHSAPSVSSTVVNPAAGSESAEANVSENLLVRAAVRGWVLTDNCPAANVQETGSNGELLPEGRCIFPDDWRFKAGGALAEETRPNYDIYGGSTSGCGGSVAGPFSQLDAPGCGGSLAPHEPFGNGYRETNFPETPTNINADDAPMPSALARFRLLGSGFIFGAEKSNPNSQFNATHIPAEPWITPINADLSGYQWNTWGAGPKSGLYNYWTSLAASGPQVVSCGRDSSDADVNDLVPCPNDIYGVPAVGANGYPGYDDASVYTDEHGVAYTYINGDANLTFDDCATSAANAGHNIVLLNGFYCESGDLVGQSTLSALVDYPDKRKHFAIASNEVTVDWTWGGVKDVTIEPGESAQFNYVVLHLLDRDGFCSGNSLHPVLGEQVIFTIDATINSSVKIAANVNGDKAALLGTVSADGTVANVTTFDTDPNVNSTIANGGIIVEPRLVPVPPDGTDYECQAWIHISESLLGSVNVKIEAFDPEGTVTFDVIVNPTPTPSPTPSPDPTQIPTQENLWADIDCDDDVDPVDSLKALIADAGQTPVQGANCPTPGENLSEVFQDGTTFTNLGWGDADCDDDVDPVDSLKILRYDAGLSSLQTEPCPDIGSKVNIPVQ